MWPTGGPCHQTINLPLLSIIARGVGIFSISKYLLAVLFAGVKDNKNVVLPSTVESYKVYEIRFQYISGEGADFTKYFKIFRWLPRPLSGFIYRPASTGRC